MAAKQDETENRVQIRPTWSLRSWWGWAFINVAVAAYFLAGLWVPASNLKTSWLPGETTHGHYQIELDCEACHQPLGEGADHSVGNVMTNACNDCHADQLKAARDTHPAKKFNDPTNAAMLQTLDAQDCLACHQEHVPDRTLAMGLTVPSDYCWHCHQDVSENRPSHVGLAFDTCSTAGCHNYHDNRALYEKFLDDHYGEPDFLPSATVMPLPGQPPTENAASARIPEPDAPSELSIAPELLSDWGETAHAFAGVNCTDCHMGTSVSDGTGGWSEQVAMDTCGSCHQRQTESFTRSRHGMRLAQGLSPMRPAMARLPMRHDASHRQLTCNACHPAHRFDRGFAASEACLDCHADSHSLAYSDSAHAQLWQQELAGEGPAGSGVSCATCHLPRVSEGVDVWVHHNQNDNLRPNETMARQVCTQCHGLEYSLSALADPRQAESCFSREVTERIESVDMARAWFAEQEAKRKRRGTRSSP